MTRSVLIIASSPPKSKWHTCGGLVIVTPTRQPTRMISPAYCDAPVTVHVKKRGDSAPVRRRCDKGGLL